MPKSENLPNVPEQTPKFNKVVTVKKAVKGLEPQTALNKPLGSTISDAPVYSLIGVMNLRRTKNIPNGKPQMLVLSEDHYTELTIRGIRSRFTWDELLRNLISDYLSKPDPIAV